MLDTGFALKKTERVYLILFSGFISLVNILNFLIILLERIYILRRLRFMILDAQINS